MTPPVTIQASFSFAPDQWCPLFIAFGELSLFSLNLPPTPSNTRRAPVVLPSEPQFTDLTTPQSNGVPSNSDLRNTFISGPPQFFGNSVLQGTSPTGANSRRFQSPFNTQPST